MKKLLIAGGGYADIPMIRAGKALGYHVITSGNRPDDMGHRHSDECHLRDFSDKAAILQLARDLAVDALCPCCNDFSAISCSWAAEQLGLPGHDPYETSLLIHHKDRYRAFAKAQGIPTPMAMGFQSVEQALQAIEGWTFPLIVKPVDLSGGKAVSKISAMGEAEPAVRAAIQRSKAKRIVVEEFIQGTRHGFSAFLRGGKVFFYFPDNEHYYRNPYLVSAASYPSIMSEAAEQKLIRDSERIASLLHLTDGIFHIQCILGPDGPVIIEIARRPPGDLYVELVRHATGMDYPAYIVKAFATQDLSGLEYTKPTSFITRHCIMTDRQGVVGAIVIDPCVREKIFDAMIWGKPGDVIEDMMTQKLGIVFLRFQSLREMLEETEQMQNLIRVEFR